MKICESCPHQSDCLLFGNACEGECLALRKLSSKLREFRHDADMTQEELAGMADIDRSYLACLETQPTNVSAGVLFRLAKALEVEPQEFFDFE